MFEEKFYLLLGFATLQKEVYFRRVKKERRYYDRRRRYFDRRRKYEDEE